MEQRGARGSLGRPDARGTLAKWPIAHEELVDTAAPPLPTLLFHNRSIGRPFLPDDARRKALINTLQLRLGVARGLPNEFTLARVDLAIAHGWSREGSEPRR